MIGFQVYNLITNFYFAKVKLIFKLENDFLRHCKFVFLIHNRNRSIMVFFPDFRKERRFTLKTLECFKIFTAGVKLVY